MKQLTILATIFTSALLADNSLPEPTTQTPLTQDFNRPQAGAGNSFPENSQVAEPAASTSKTQGPHHFRTGVDVFWQHLSARQPFQDHDEQGSIHYKTNSSFVGPRVEYEYIQPGSCYFAFQGMIADGSTSLSIDARHPQQPYPMTFKKNHISSTFANLETRLGNVFEHGPIMVILNGGIGWNYLKFDTEEKPYNSWFYALGGLRTLYKATNFLELGIYADATYSFYGHNIKERFWGYEAGLPVIFYTGKNNMFSIKLEPYYQQFNVKQHLFNLGSRLEFGVKF